MNGNIVDIKPYIFQAEAHEARLERTIQRMWIALIITIFLLVGSNMLWVLYELQYDYTATTYTQEADIDTGSGDAIINNGGDMSYGTGKGKTDGDN